MLTIRTTAALLGPWATLAIGTSFNGEAGIQTFAVSSADALVNELRTYIFDEDDAPGWERVVHEWASSPQGSQFVIENDEGDEIALVVIVGQHAKS